MCWRNNAVDAGNRHFLAEFEAERPDDGCHQKNAYSSDHVFCFLLR